jgi:hypothetical protein
MNCSSLCHYTPCQRPSAGCNGGAGGEVNKQLRKAIIRRKLEKQPLWANNTRHIRIAEPRRRFDQRVEHSLQVEGGAADNLEHVSSSGLLLQGFGEVVSALAQFLEQAGVLYGDDCLVGEILN